MSLGLGFGQPFQPSVDFAYLFKGGIVLYGISHTAYNYDSPWHIALLWVYPVQAWGLGVWYVILARLVRHPHYRAPRANDYVGFSNAKWKPHLLCPLPSKCEKYPGGVRLSVTLEPLQTLLTGLGRTLSTPPSAPKEQANDAVVCEIGPRIDDRFVGSSRLALHLFGEEIPDSAYFILGADHDTQLAVQTDIAAPVVHLLTVHKLG